MNFKEKLKSYVDVINDFLDKYIVVEDVPEKVLYSSMKYSLEAGGKRLRPVLSLSVCDMLDGNINDVIPYACAIEMIHTYSLIHDDLPSMDDDNFRRGKPTNHKVFGEAIAILAGDGLLNSAFELMLKASSYGDKGLDKKIKAISVIANASGIKGMIAGQVIDLESEDSDISPELLKRMHKCKTGALIKAPVISSAVLCGASKDEIKHLESFSENIGLAFQIKDDILDIEGDSDKLGKNIGSDASNGKSTFVSIYGLDKSKEMLFNITANAVSDLDIFGDKALFLKELSKYLLERDI